MLQEIKGNERRERTWYFIDRKVSKSVTFEQNAQQEAIGKKGFQEQVWQAQSLQGTNRLGMFLNTRQNNCRGVIGAWAVWGACLLRVESYDSQQ